MFEIEIRGKQETKKETRKRTHSEMEESDVEEMCKSDASLILRRTLEMVSNLVEDIEINATDKGLYIQVMDSMHACIADIFLCKKIFDKFRCDRSINLGLKLKNLMKIFRSLTFAGNYTFKMYCSDDADVMVLTYDCERYSLAFDVPLASFDVPKYTFPTQEYDAEVEMNTRDFALVPKIVGTFDENITIEARDKCFSFYQGNEQAKACLKIKEMEDVSINIANEIKKEIAMKYIICTGKAATMCDSMRIGVSSASPVFFDFGLGEQGYIRFYIAPKIVDQDDD